MKDEGLVRPLGQKSSITTSAMLVVEGTNQSKPPTGRASKFLHMIIHCTGKPPASPVLFNPNDRFQISILWPETRRPHSPATWNKKSFILSTYVRSR
ncbi:hypothetical protein I7I48_09242 [Histoplasma ohiense]|nr:hypothetical protein I7I48_09242 [Histoplasma ohiense (nom. inval.)]